MLEVSHVSGRWKKFQIKDVSFTAPEGYITGLVGKNGAGKTTLLRLILDIVGKRRGSITLNGLDSVRDGAAFREQVGFVMEEAGFLRGKSPVENGRLFGELYGNWEEGLFLESLQRFGISRSKSRSEAVGSFSKGEYVRFQLAFALAHHPKLLLLDEPTANLDPVFRIEFLEQLQAAIEEEDVAVLFATHITSDLDKIGDYLVVLEHGAVRCAGEKEELFDKYGTYQTAEVLLRAAGEQAPAGLKISE